MEDDNFENISSQYLNNEQIKVYLEACLDHRITDFQVMNDSQKINEDYYNKDEFERLKKKRIFKEQDNLFYRVWVYQYEGLKELLKQSEEKIINRPGITTGIRDLNYNDDSKPKGIEKDKKSLSFRFTFGKIDIKDLQKENLFYQQLTENPNVNFDEYKPTEQEITSQKKNLKIIFLYTNLGTPLLEEDCEVEEVEDELSSDPKRKKEKYIYKYEFDIDRIVYYRKISFSLYEQDDSIPRCCKEKAELYWCLEDKDNFVKYYCPMCFKKIEDKSRMKILENTKYSIRYFLFCHEEGHHTKKYEYYCKECNRAYCIKCLTDDHKDLNKIHKLEEIEDMEIESYKSFCKEKKEKIHQQKKKNNEKWDAINEAGDNAESSLRKRESKAIIDVKNEVLARCTFLTSIGYELQRIIAEIDAKKKFIEDARKDSNVASYLNMNNMFVEDMKKHYLPNLEYIEKLPLEKYIETFHKIDKKYPTEPTPK